MTDGAEPEDLIRWIKYLTANEVLSGHEPRWRFRLFVWALGLAIYTETALARRLAAWLWLPEWEP